MPKLIWGSRIAGLCAGGKKRPNLPRHHGVTETNLDTMARNWWTSPPRGTRKKKKKERRVNRGHHANSRGVSYHLLQACWGRSLRGLSSHSFQPLTGAASAFSPIRWDTSRWNMDREKSDHSIRNLPSMPLTLDLKENGPSNHKKRMNKTKFANIKFMYANLKFPVRFYYPHALTAA